MTSDLKDVFFNFIKIDSLSYKNPNHLEKYHYKAEAKIWRESEAEVRSNFNIFNKRIKVLLSLDKSARLQLLQNGQSCIRSRFPNAIELVSLQSQVSTK